MATIDDVLLPRGWTKTVRASVLHAITVAFTTLTRAWGAAATSRRPSMQAELDRARTEVALLREELAIKNDRMHRVLPHRRPH